MSDKMLRCDFQQPGSLPRITQSCQRISYLSQNFGIIDSGWYPIFAPIGNFFDGPPQDFAGTGLGQSVDDGCLLESRDRADAISDHLHQVLDDLIVLPFDADFEHYES